MDKMDSLDFLVESIVEEHEDIGINVLHLPLEHWKFLPIGTSFTQTEYDTVINRIQAYISENFHGADCRCFPGCLADSAHSDAIKRYVREAFEPSTSVPAVR